jgi:hypothetical protein
VEILFSMATMRRVILESPFAGDRKGNIEYGRRCVRDCLARGEAPIASHLLYTQEGVLDDEDPEQRKLGIDAGLAWLDVADAMVVYIDKGTSSGMRSAIERARRANIKIELRALERAEIIG